MHAVERSDGRYSFIAGAAYNPGDIIVRPDATLAILDGLESTISGQLISPEPLVPSNILVIDAPSASTWSAGASVYWDNTNKVFTATSSGNTYAGKAIVAKTNGQLTNKLNCV